MQGPEPGGGSMLRATPLEDPISDILHIREDHNMWQY
jgi:hypothetical protein